MWARQLIEDRLQNARENLDVLDKNLNRITGKPDGQPTSARRRLGVAPSSSPMSIKSRLHIGPPPIRRGLGSSRTELEGREEYVSEDDGDANPTGAVRTVKSNVTIAGSRTAAAVQDQLSSKVLSDSTTKERGKRFFGILTQTLHSFQEKENEKKPTLNKRAEIEKKVEAAEKLEKAEAAVERRELFRERLLREEEIVQLKAKMDRAQMLEDWESAMQKSKGNIMTSSRPPVFYRPKLFNKRLTELQKKTERYIDGLIWERNEEMRQELHILPSGEAKTNGDVSGGAKQSSTNASNTTGDDSIKPQQKCSSSNLGSLSSGKVSNGTKQDTTASNKSPVETSSTANNNSSAPEAEGKVVKGGSDSADLVLTSNDGAQTTKASNAANNNITSIESETPKSLAEELGAPGEDIENLLVEQQSVETPTSSSTAVTKKESTASNIASAVVVQTDQPSLNKAGDGDNTESNQKHQGVTGSEATSSTTKKQRNYRHRSPKSGSRDKKKRRSDSVSGRGSSKKDAKNKETDSKKQGTETQKQTEKRRSDKRPQSPEMRSKERKKRSVSPERNSKTKPEAGNDRRRRADAPEKGKTSRRKRSGSVEKREKSDSKKRRKQSSSSDRSSTSPVERKRNSKLDSQSTTKVSKSSLSEKSSNAALKKPTQKSVDKSFEVEPAKKTVHSFDSTFGSELKKVKQNSEREKVNVTQTVQTTSTFVNDKKLEISQSKSVSTIIAASADTAPVSTAPAEGSSQAPVAVETSSVPVAVPTHSPLKSTDLFKSINPSLLPVDHQNLTFKITTSIFQTSSATPNLTNNPVLPPVDKVVMPTLENLIPQQTEKSTLSSIQSSENLKPATTDFYPGSAGNNQPEIMEVSTTQSQIKLQEKPVSKDSSVQPMANKPKSPVAKKRRSPSTSSSSSESDEDDDDDSETERRNRKSRRSPARRHSGGGRRGGSRKRRSSHSRRRRRPTSPKRKSTSRHRRRRPSSRERKRPVSSRKRRSSPVERRRRRPPSSSSSASSSSSGSESSSEGSVKGEKDRSRRKGSTNKN